MADIISLLVSYGYWGMFVTAFIAGSFFPFSSEAVMTGLLAAGLDPWLLIIYGTTGNVLGGMFNYFMGRMGKLASNYPEIYAKFAASGIRSISKKDYEAEIMIYKAQKVFNLFSIV